MRQRLALIIALAGFAALTALGVGMAGAEGQSAGLGEGQVAEALAAPDSSALAPEPPACANGVDDDEDGLADLEDPDCESPEDDEEETTPAAPEGEAQDAAPPPQQAQPQRGDSLDAGAAADAGVTRNEKLGTTNSRSGGGLAAPAATAGDQPGADGPNGGSQYGSGGSPTTANPSTTIAPFGPAPIGVPNFVIDSFEIPPFLLPIYQACGTEYGVPWEVLASINKIETAFGTNLNVSSAGAMGWMQFLPSSWQTYGLDANGDGRKDPYNPVDAICAAAHYLKVAGAEDDLYGAIFAYNHADWYVQEVLLYARAYGKIPSDLIGSLTGLTEGAHFPVAADARYADDVSARAAGVISSSPTRRGINIFAAKGAPVVAVNDGTIVKRGESKRLGRFIVLRDPYGNRYIYAQLGRFVRNKRKVVMPDGRERRIPVDSENIRPRLRAYPGRARTPGQGDGRAGVDPATASGADGTIKVKSRVIAGTVVARVGDSASGVDPHINFAIRPVGKGAPRIDPKPILDGWKLLEATAIYRAKGKNPLTRRLSGAGVLLLPKAMLARRVLAEKRIEVSDCDRLEIRGGQIDRRLLAALAYLADQGYRLTITSMLCGRHGSITTSGNISYHSYGNAADIALIDGVPVLGHQGPGSITEDLLRAVLRLQGTLVPDELISLQNLGGPSFAMADHADHVHIGYSPVGGSGARFVQLLKPDQWLRLTDRLGQIENPDVPTAPSKFALPAGKKQGEGD